MHVHNALHRIVRLQSAYKAALGEQSEEFSGIERAGETLTPIIDLWSVPEWAFLRGELLWARAQSSQAAVAAEFGFHGILNSTTNHIITVTRVRSANGVAGTRTFLGLVVPAVGVVIPDAEVSGAARDTGYSKPNIIIPQVRVVRGGSTVVLVVQQMTFAATTAYDVAVSYVLRPNSALLVQAETANVTVVGPDFEGSIRPALPGEL